MPPNTLWLRYRAALAEAIRTIGRSALSATTKAVRQAMAASVVPDDKERFAKLVLEKFRTLPCAAETPFALDSDYGA